MLDKEKDNLDVDFETSSFANRIRTAPQSVSRGRTYIPSE